MELTEYTINCYDSVEDCGNIFKEFKEEVDDADNIFSIIIKFNEPTLDFLKVQQRMIKIIRDTIKHINEYETAYGPSICAYAFLKIYNNELEKTIRDIIDDGNEDEEDVEFLNDNYIIPYNINYNLEDQDDNEFREYNKYVADCNDDDCEEEAVVDDF